MSNDVVLDVGCFDGYWLSTQIAKRKVGLDLDIVKQYSDIKYVRGSGLNIPLSDNVFDKVFAFDVIEHIPPHTEVKFLRELHRVTKKGGVIILTVPSKDIKIFPSFMTNYVSNKWGHEKYTGLSRSDILNYLKEINDIKYIISELNTRRYLNMYFLLRFIWPLFPEYTKLILRSIATLDMKSPNGTRGYYMINILKK